jgi:hypothetical protein
MFEKEANPMASSDEREIRKVKLKGLGLMALAYPALS